MPTYIISTPPATNHLFVNVRGQGRRKSAAYSAWIRGELKALPPQAWIITHRPRSLAHSSAGANAASDGNPQDSPTTGTNATEPFGFIIRLYYSALLFSNAIQPCERHSIERRETLKFKEQAGAFRDLWVRRGA